VFLREIIPMYLGLWHLSGEQDQLRYALKVLRPML